MAEFSDLLRTRRSIRDFQDREVESGLIREIIMDSCLAPSASNRQPWQFIIINRKDRLKQLSEESKANLLKDLEENPTTLLRNYEAILRNETFNVFYNAPCLVYIGGPRSVRSLEVDCALAASYFMFSAATRGLGTCWVALGSRIKNPATLRELEIPEDYRIVAPVIVGYPRTMPDIPERRDPQILKVIE
jgi:nitroreductase